MTLLWSDTTENAYKFFVQFSLHRKMKEAREDAKKGKQNYQDIGAPSLLTLSSFKEKRKAFETSKI